VKRPNDDLGRYQESLFSGCPAQGYDRFEPLAPTASQPQT
jgi:hypothetical protein